MALRGVPVFALVACSALVPPSARPNDDAKPGRTPVKGFTNSLDAKVVRIPAGEFLMGTSGDEFEDLYQEGKRLLGFKEIPGWLTGEGPRRKVKITKAFYLATCEVTQGEYEKVMGNNLSHFSPMGAGRDKINGLDTTRLPAENVSYEDAVEFCKRLSAMAAEKGRTYRLPTEAEWEYACRAGTKTATSFGDAMSSARANFNGTIVLPGTKKGIYLGRTSAVGSYEPNAFGLFDMHGNVQEWCSDWFDETYYAEGAGSDPQGPKKGGERVLRGGGWFNPGWVCRSACRNYLTPESRSFGAGFRVACGHP